MHVSRISPEKLRTRRLDADFYYPNHIAVEERMLSLEHMEFGSCGRFFVGPFGSKLPGNLYLEKGVPLFRVANVGEFQVKTENLAHLDEAVHAELSASEVRPGDLLIVKASVGEKICKIPDWIPKANITQHIIAIRPNGTADTDFLSAFLFSRYGRSQLERYSLGSIIQYLGVIDARSVLIPRWKNTCQRYLGDKVRQAERLRAWANLESSSVDQRFVALTSNPRPARKYWLTKQSLLSPYRINPKQYDPVVLDLLQRARASGIELVPLGKMLDDRGTAGGATPLGAAYADEGIFFVRVQNVKRLVLDLSDVVFIDEDADEQLARSRCAADDIILTITGYPGTAALVTEQDLPVNINQHSVRLSCNSEFDSAYVCAALNSKFVKIQVDRAAIGGTRDALDYPSVRGLLVPIMRDQTDEIASMVRGIILAHRSASGLVSAAMFLVEALIEGQITESDLVNAQQALEAGDDGPERAILARLRTDGLDGSGAPLFPDLDRLAALLEQVELEAVCDAD